MVQYRSLTKLTEPSIEPVSVAEAKAHCRIDTDGDDTYIGSLITAAREYCETHCDMTFAPTEYRIRLDRFPAEIEIPRPPMANSGTVTAVSVTYLSYGTVTAALTSAEFTVDRDAKPGTIRPAGAWPGYASTNQNAITVLWWGGQPAADVSQRVKAAILWLVGMWYERRMAADQASLSEVPFGVRALLDSVKWRAVV